MAGFPSGWGSFGPGYNTSDCNLDVIGREEQLEIQIGAMFNMYDVTGRCVPNATLCTST